MGFGGGAARLRSVGVAVLVAGVLAHGAAAAPRVARVEPESSPSLNWAGFVSLGPAQTAGRFTRVSASWLVPTATCTIQQDTYSSFWVGLGGVVPQSHLLEQIGSGADCGIDGMPRYYLWYELWPSAPYGIWALISPGETINASVTILSKHRVRLQIADVQLGTHFSKTVKVRRADGTSAEWIAEAPTECAFRGNCRVQPLTNFGSVAFSNALATARGHIGTISDPAWTSIASLLQPDLPPAPLGNGRMLLPPQAPSGAAAPGELSPDGTAFSVSYQPPQ